MATNEQDLVNKLMSDPDFRGALKTDPKGTLRKHGATIPDDVEIVAVESTEKKLYLVIPPLATEELTDEQLAGAAGGFGFGFSGGGVDFGFSL